MNDGDVPDNSPARGKRRHRVRWFIAAAVLIVGALVGGLLWYSHANRYVSIAGRLVDEGRGQTGKPNLLDRLLVKVGLSQPRKGVRESLVDEAETMAVLTAAVTRLDKPEDRLEGLNVLIDMRTAAASEVIARALEKEPDPTVRSVEILLLGLYRDKAHLPIFREGLRDADPAVRAAAADAVGVLHHPAYNIPIVVLRFLPPFPGKANPAVTALVVMQSRINVEPIVFLSRYCTTQQASIEMGHHIRNDEIALDAGIREELVGMMTDGSTAGEREAAARALLGWPEEKYRLRLAEWGVWIADAGKLVLAKSITDEIPPFVHRTGNTIAELNKRVNQIMFIDKPIIHLTGDRPMPVDLEVRISLGRPWFAYPLPDDFGMTAMHAFWLGRTPYPTKPLAHPLAPLEKAQVPSLPDNQLRVGYPWSWPNRKEYGSMRSGVGSLGNVLTAVGVRWQSVIVYPKDRPWMTWAAVPDDPRFAWWKALRDVPSSAVTSRGETERFLYYDGPTLAESPVLVQRSGRKLSFQNQRVFPEPATGLVDSREPPEELPPLPGMGDVNAMVAGTVAPPAAARKGLAIDVAADGKVNAWTMVAPVQGGQVTLAAVPPAKTAAEAEAALRKLITDAGLTAPEAEGLIRAWRKQFFQTPGRRFLLLLTRADYDAICPMWIRPAPTEIARVGLVLTEFDVGEASAAPGGR